MERNEVSKSIESIVKEMELVSISNQEEYDFSASWLKRCKDTQSAVDAAFEEDRVRTKAAYDKVLEDRRQFKAPLEKAEAICRKKMSDYATEAENKRRELQAEADRKAREDAAPAALCKAEELEAMGRKSQADKVIDRASVVKAAPVSPKVGKLMESWSVSVTDRQVFLSEAVAFPDLLACLELNLSKTAAIMKGWGRKDFPGLKVEVSFRPVL